MAVDPRIESAVRNNALWCDTVCRAHGVPGEFVEPLVWLARGAVPRFYPNVVTLSAPADGGAQLATINTSSEALPVGSWSAKDSYGRLDLTALGFRALFDATWLWRPAEGVPAAAVGPGLRWVRVRDASTLAAWEATWAGGDASPAEPRVFLPSLLADERIAFVAAFRGRRCVAGGVLAHMARVVGLSNVFVQGVEPMEAWMGCIAAASTMFPGRPIVGYERHDGLALARRLHFETLGPLRVWVRADPFSAE